MTTEEIDYISKNLFLKQFESDDTSDYIKSKVNLCADEMIKKIVTCEEDLRNNRIEFEKAIHSKIALSEHTNISFRIDLEKLNTKMIQDISSLQNTMIELKKQLEFNILSVSKIQTFQSRENEIIISIQCRLDLIESCYNNEKSLSKKINTLESKLNAQCLKTKNLETIVKGELRKEISKEYEDIIEQKLKDINLKITNMIKKYENRYEDYNSKFIHLVSEINSLREKLDSNIINDNTNFLITELTTKTTTDMSKLYDRIKIEQSYIKTELNKHICEESLKLTESINFHNDNETEKYNIIHRKLDECNQIRERISNLEQQMICQMTSIHNMSIGYNYSHDTSYTESE
tara:strand:- start:963 stop:2003 length:1041 start_codon:yes stop_codon:yes gene_type:complete